MEQLVWYANSDDPYHVLRRSGALMVGIAVGLFVLVLCAAARSAGPGSTLLLAIFGALVPLAAGLALWEFLVDRRAATEIRLAPADRPVELTVRRVDGTATTHPVQVLTLVEITHYETGRPCTGMKLHVGGRVIRCRTGPAKLPSGWVEILTASDVQVTVRTRSD